MSKILGVNIDPPLRQMIHSALTRDGHEIQYSPDYRSIKNPGRDFDPARLEHAAVNNPNDEPMRHALIRDEKGCHDYRNLENININCNPTGCSNCLP